MRPEGLSPLDGWVGVHALPWLLVGLVAYLFAEGAVATAGGVAALASAVAGLLVAVHALWSSR